MITGLTTRNINRVIVLVSRHSGHHAVSTYRINFNIVTIKTRRDARGNVAYLDFESRVLDAGGSSSACDTTYAGVGVFHLHGMGLIPPLVWIADGELPHPQGNHFSAIMNPLIIVSKR